MEELLQVGVITSTHGIRGRSKCFRPRMTRRDSGTEGCDAGYRERDIVLEIEGEIFKQFVILKFKGIDNINDVERYKRCPLYVKREDAVELEEDEYFIADMIGMKVITDEGRIWDP